MSLDDSDFAGPPEIIKGMARPDMFNGVRARFQNSRKDRWPQEDAPAYESPTYQRQDGGKIITREIDMPGTVDEYMVHRITKQMLHRARAGLKLRATFNTKVFQLSPEQMVYISSRSLGMASKPFRVKSYRPNGLNKVDMEFQEDGPLLYEWNFDEAAVDPAPNTNLVSVRNVPEVQNPRANTSLATAVFAANGQVSAICKVTWDPVTDAYVLAGGAVLISYKRSYEAVYTNAPRLDPTRTEFSFPIMRGEEVIITLQLANAYAKGPIRSIRKIANDAPASAIFTTNYLYNSSFTIDRTKDWTTPEGVAAGATFENRYSMLWLRVPGWYKRWRDGQTGIGYETGGPNSPNKGYLSASLKSPGRIGAYVEYGATTSGVPLVEWRIGDKVWVESDKFHLGQTSTDIVMFTIMYPNSSPYFMEMYFFNDEDVVTGRLYVEEEVKPYMLQPRGVNRDQYGNVITKRIIGKFGTIPIGTTKAMLRIGITIVKQWLNGGGSFMVEMPMVGASTPGQIAFPAYQRT